jgi:hypothetical protein
MSTINQGPAELDIVAPAGTPFPLLITATLTDSGNNPIAWSAVTNLAVEVVRYGSPVAAAIPVVTSPTAGQIGISWTGAQTAFIGAGQVKWVLSCSINGVGPSPLIAGTFTANAPTMPGASSPTSASLSVVVGTANVVLDVTVIGVGGAGASTFTFSQSNPATVWNIAHNLGRHPSVTLVDTAGDYMSTDFQYVDANNITVTFNAATAGAAYLN